MPKKLLKISEFAAISGISRKLLIYYDKYGILHPEAVDRENNYRYYSYRQIDTANVIVSLREVGMPLESIRRYLTTKSPENLLKVLEMQEDSLDGQIQKLLHIKELIHRRNNQIRKGIMEEVNTVRIEEQPAEYLFLGPELPDDYDLAEGWAYLPEFYKECNKANIQLGGIIGTLVSQENLVHSLWNKPNYYFYHLSDDQYPSFYTKPKGTYVIGTAYADYGQVDWLYHKLTQYISKNHLHICGNSYEEYLIDEIAEADPERYLLQVAIQVTIS